MHAPVPKLPARMPAERSRTRRERRSEAARRPVLHVVMPGLEVARAAPRKGETVTAFLRRTGWATRDPKYGWQFRKHLPTILEVNGEPVLRKQWRRTKIAANDNVRFVSYPLGGGRGSTGKQVLGLVALVAVAAFAGPLGAAFAGGLGLTGTAATIVGGLATAAIGLGGALLVNALTAPKPGATNDPSATVDQIYSVQAQGNVAKLGQPLPVPYGRTKWYPDFAATPWGEFVGNDQYLNILLSVGMGSFEYDRLDISDTPFWNPTDGVSSAFSSATIRFYEAGDTIDLFPINVSQSDEVNGQQLPHGTGITNQGATTPGDWVGGFVASPAGETAYQIAIDYVFPGGCFLVDDNGNTTPLSVSLLAERRLVDDAGAPTGDWETLVSATRAYSSRSPIRDSFLVGVPAGRYEVRFRRNDGVPADNKGASDIVWAGLRAYLTGGNSFPDVATIAIRIKATESTQGSYKFGVLATRKLPVWDGSSFVTQATRNPAWALYDAATNTQYGAGILPSKIDFNAIVAFADGCTSRGDTFDYNFTSAVAVPDAFDKILTVARARHFWLGDMLSVVRDQWDDVPTMLLTDREIVRGSTQVTWTMLGEDDPDAVVIEYVDENTWLPAQVQYPPDSVTFTATNAETKRLDGIVNRNQAYREAAFYYLQSIYRRENVQIGCEYEGRAITFGQTLRIQSELPENYGQAGAVMASGGTGGRTLTLSPVPTWADSGNFIRLRRPNGTYFGPVNVTKGDDDSQAVLNATDLATVEGQQGTTLADVLARADGGEFPSFELGTADNQSKVVKVLTGQPNGDTFTLTMVVDDERVHTTDLGDPPILPVGQFPANSQTPLIAGLNAQWVSDVLEPKLGASWFPAAGAIYYRADVSYDSGATWIQVYEGVDNKFTQVVARSALTLRVQAIGVLPGPYSTVDLEAPTIQLGDSIVAYESLKDAVQELVTTYNDERHAANEKKIAQLAQLINQALNRTSIDKKIVKSDISASSDRASSAITEVQQVAVDAQSAVADLSTAVAAQFDDVNASVMENSSAIATLDGYAAARWSVAVDVNGNAVGLVLFNDSDNVSTLTVTADTFQVAFPGHTGGTAVPVFTVADVGGVAKLALRGDMIVDGSIITQMIQAGAITSVTLAANAVTATSIQAGAVNTSALAINSVGIDQIIANAASNFQVYTTPNVGGGSTQTIISESVDIRGGKAMALFFSQGDSGSYGSGQSMTLTGTIDGASFVSLHYQPTFDGSATGTILGPIFAVISASGLSDGSHTFAFSTNAKNLAAGTMIVLNPRR